MASYGRRNIINSIEVTLSTGPVDNDDDSDSTKNYGSLGTPKAFATRLDENEKDPTHECPACDYGEHIQTPYTTLPYWCVACDDIRSFRRIADE